MDADSDFDFEPIPGLPETLPEGERILWQGRPDPWALAKGAFKIQWVAGYFALLGFWRFGASSADYPVTEALLHAVPLVVLGAGCCLLLCAIAWLQARATVYTLTNRRVAMRIGAALQMTLNLPYVCIENANLSLRKDGTGTLALQLNDSTRLSHLMTWPHVRPWKIARTEPALRCISDASQVAQLLSEAAEARVSDATSIRVSAKHAPTSVLPNLVTSKASGNGKAIPAE